MLEVVTIIQYMGKIPAVDVRLLNSKKPAKSALRGEFLLNQQVMSLQDAVDLPVPLRRWDAGSKKRYVDSAF